MKDNFTKRFLLTGLKTLVADYCEDYSLSNLNGQLEKHNEKTIKKMEAFLKRYKLQQARNKK
jgi:hypothetical protein